MLKCRLGFLSTRRPGCALWRKCMFARFCSGMRQSAVGHEFHVNESTILLNVSLSSNAHKTRSRVDHLLTMLCSGAGRNLTLPLLQGLSSQCSPRLHRTQLPRATRTDYIVPERTSLQNSRLIFQLPLWPCKPQQIRTQTPDNISATRSSQYLS